MTYTQQSWRLTMAEIRANNPEWTEAMVQDYFARGEDIINAESGGGGDGEDNTSSNLPGGLGLAAPKVGVDLPFKSLVAGTNISLGQDANTITINSTTAGGGEDNTQTNQGAGFGLGLPKDGVDLPIKSILPGSNVTITAQADTITIAAASGGGGDQFNIDGGMADSIYNPPANTDGGGAAG